MIYGFEYINNEDVVTVDSEFSRIVVVSKGRYAPTQESGLGSTTYFSSVVTSQEPPLVFVKPDKVNAVAGLCRALILGSPGNWTGFYVRAYSSTSAQPNGYYFAAGFQVTPSAQYGAQLYDASDKLVFDTGSPVAVFTKALQTWTYITAGTDAQGLPMAYFSVPFDFSSNDYMLINNFSMDMAGSQTRDISLYCWWDFPSNRLWAITIGAAVQNSLYLPVVFSKMQA
ncbi:hypothetical protein [Pseudomonas sp. 2822-15]|uniref:hypothetical protein n=1 Tax=Pseudomonas sp. 2822-15 TaxID=1712677 RepID=UPI000C1539CD|nr:hypothetical protein [Pseudomonas sp. 2822-15]